MERPKKQTAVAEPEQAPAPQQDALQAPDPKALKRAPSPGRQAMDEEERLRKQRAEREADQKKNPAKTMAEQVAESRKALKQPLAPGMAFYESPEGFVVVGEASRGTVWCHQANHGKGMKINPMR
jgi:flagellar biosynthesis GTPase FlhF